MLLVNLSASESTATKKNETYYLSYTAFTKIISGTKMTTLAIVISNYEGLDWLSWCVNCEMDIIHDSEGVIPMITIVYINKHPLQHLFEL